MRYPKYTRVNGTGIVIDLLPRVWIVVGTRTDDDLDYDADGYPLIRSYRFVRLVIRSITFVMEWER